LRGKGERKRRWAVVCLAAATCLCGWTETADAAGLPFLRLSSGARGSALGEAVTALADLEAMTYNPAALTTSGSRGVSIGHSEWIQDIRHEYLALVAPRGAGTIALTGAFSQVDELERRTGPSTLPLGNFGVYDSVVGVGYARDWSPKLRLGVGVKMVRQSIFTETADGIAADVGALYRLSPSLRLAVAARNLGTMGKLASESTELPAEARIGAAYRGPGHLLVVVDLQRVRDTGTSLHLGTEYAIQRRLALRAGYQTTESRDLSLGLGVHSGSWAFDYAFVPFASGLGDAHRVGIRFQGSR
jgi:hypothetical protein